MAVPKKRKSKNATSIKKQSWKKNNENTLKNTLTLYFKSLAFPSSNTDESTDESTDETITKGFGKTDTIEKS